jgi:hypothetical protein
MTIQFLRIPLPTSEEALVTQVTQLEGASYRFTFNFNSRTDRWSLGLATESGEQIIDGALLCMGIDLLRTVPSTLSTSPPGQLYVVGTDDPTLLTISQVDLIYLTSDV